MLIVAELIGFCQFSTFQFMFLKKHKRVEKTLDSYQGKELPSVDVLICTYNEPLSLLRKTLVAALNMDYPAEKLNVYICDDGNREEVSNLCMKFGAHWVNRENNIGSKAGNLNHALSITSGELFLVLDADMIPKKEFLLKTLGYFVDEDVAFVQTPQVFYNMDMYQYNFKNKLPNEQDFFMRDVQEARAAINAVLHVGTNAVFRKKYVEEIGGYPTCSITEDMAVGMLLHAKQYRGIFINEELAYGLSATTFTDLLKQRDRWCRGNLQVMFKLWRKASPGLSFAQKIAYFDGVLYWFSSIQKMIYLFMPIIHLLFGISIINATILDIAIFYIPYFYGQLLIFRTLSPNTRSLRWAHIYDTAMAPYLTVSILKQLLNLKTAFNVTPKEFEYDKGYYQIRTVIPHIILAALSVVSCFTGYLYLQENIIADSAFVINIVWGIFNLYALAICMYVAYQKPLTQTQESFSLDMPFTVAIKTASNGIAKTFSLDYFTDNKAGITLDGTNSFDIYQNVWFSYDGTSYAKGQIIEVKDRHVEILFSELDKRAFSLYMNIYVKKLKTPYKHYKTS